MDLEIISLYRVLIILAVEAISVVITIILAKLLTMTRLTTWEPVNG